MYSIKPVEKRYAWGSRTRLQRLFGLDDAASLANEAPGSDVDESLNDSSSSPDLSSGEPLAEMWFSGHAQWPSLLQVSSSQNIAPIPLTQAIRSQPQAMLGARCSAQFGPVLPYLLKVISARIPLSLQVHPVDFEARAGFNAQNAAGVPLNAPERSFRDAVAKNEMVVALEPFEASVGFASHAFMVANLELVDHPVARRMVQLLGRTDCDAGQADRMMPAGAVVWPPSRKRVFRAFHAAVTAGPVDGLVPALEHARTRMTETKGARAFAYALEAAHAFEGDASVLALLMMNPVQLAEGESVFIPAGTVHAYIHGTAAEIMTNSDNVLRAGMTVKPRDIGNLLHSLNCRSAPPIDPSAGGLRTILGDRVVYRPRISEFMLTYGRFGESKRQWLERLTERYGKMMAGAGRLQRHYGPRIVLCTEGEVSVATAVDARVLTQGQAVFVPAAEGWLDIGKVNGEYAQPAEGAFICASTQV